VFDQWNVCTCIDLTDGTFSYRVQNDFYPGEQYDFATSETAQIAAKIFNKPIDTAIYFTKEFFRKHEYVSLSPHDNRAS
jgi:hypothetical protein